MKSLALNLIALLCFVLVVPTTIRAQCACNGSAPLADASFGAVQNVAIQPVISSPGFSSSGQGFVTGVSSGFDGFPVGGQQFGTFDNGFGYSGAYQNTIPSYRQVQAFRETRAFPRTPFSSPPFFRASTNLPRYNTGSARYFGSGYSTSGFPSSTGFQNVVPTAGCGCGG